MRNWRVLTAIAAVVLAAIAGVLVWQYVNDADDRAEEKLDQVEVLVATQTIQRGTSGETAIDNGFIATEQRVAKDVPDNALRPDQEQDIKNLFAAGTIAQGRELFIEDFIAGGQVQGTALDVEEGKQAVSLTVDDSHGVAGFVAPGDTINVMASTEIDMTRDANNRIVEIKPLNTTEFLLPGVKVLAVGKTTTFGTATPPRTDTNGDGVVDDQDETPEPQAQQAGLITIEVTPRQALQLAHAQSGESQIYVSLNPPDFDVTTDFAEPGEIVEEINYYDQNLVLVKEAIDAMRRPDFKVGDSAQP